MCHKSTKKCRDCNTLDTSYWHDPGENNSNCSTYHATGSSTKYTCKSCKAAEDGKKHTQFTNS